MQDHVGSPPASNASGVAVPFVTAIEAQVQAEIIHAIQIQANAHAQTPIYAKVTQMSVLLSRTSFSALCFTCQMQGRSVRLWSGLERRGGAESALRGRSQ